MPGPGSLFFRTRQGADEFEGVRGRSRAFEGSPWTSRAVRGRSRAFEGSFRGQPLNFEGGSRAFEGVRGQPPAALQSPQGPPESPGSPRQPPRAPQKAISLRKLKNVSEISEKQQISWEINEIDKIQARNRRPNEIMAETKQLMIGNTDREIS
jgi:hypothetical protein